MANKSRASQTMRIDLHPDFESVNKDEALVFEQTAANETAVLSDKKEASDADYNKLLQSIYDGVLISDMNGRILDCNKKALKMFGMNDDLVGTHIVDRVQGMSKEVLDTLRRNLSDSRHTIIDTSCVMHDRSVFAAEIAVNSMAIDDIDHMCFFIRDITVRRRALTDLEDAVARLEEHDTARSQFVSNVSHELRTPLTSMIYAVTNLLRGVAGPLPERVEKYLKMMDGDCKRLLGTVNDILDLGKIENKKLVLSKANLSFSRFARSTVASLQGQADAKSIKLTVEDHGDPRRWFVACDPHKIERVLLNLLGNSMKFTNEGGSIVVTIEDDPEHQNFLRCSVRDDGIGIPENMVDHVMKRYFRVGEQVIGSGLGLSLSKDIIEHHGGGIGVASPPPGYDKGTIVSILLPITEPPSILVVDDEQEVRKLIGKQLESYGYTIRLAESGEEAIKALTEAPADLVILDLIMPTMDGDEVIMRLKSDKKLMGIPLIVVTGGNVSGAKAEILDGYSIPAMSKPWQDDELLNNIDEAFLGKAVLR